MVVAGGGGTRGRRGRPSIQITEDDVDRDRKRRKADVKKQRNATTHATISALPRQNGKGYKMRVAKKKPNVREIVEKGRRSRSRLTQAARKMNTSY